MTHFFKVCDERPLRPRHICLLVIGSVARVVLLRDHRRIHQALNPIAVPSSLSLSIHANLCHYNWSNCRGLDSSVRADRLARVSPNPQSLGASHPWALHQLLQVLSWTAGTEYRDRFCNPRATPEGRFKPQATANSGFTDSRCAGSRLRVGILIQTI